MPVLSATLTQPEIRVGDEVPFTGHNPEVLECVLRCVLDDLSDGVSMGGSHDEGARDKHVQSALQNFAGFGGRFSTTWSPPLE
jgi:hypothetical protein